LLSLNGGSVNIVDAGGITDLTYTLFTYGSLAGSVANLGTPTGPAGFSYALVDTGSSIQLEVSLPTLPGDFNEDGVVDGADYVVWRKNGGTQAEFDEWRANFGATQGSGGGSSVAPPSNESNSAVPEPAAMGLVVIACTLVQFLRHARRPMRQLASVPIAVRISASKLRSRG
jgi:hypothetical protein